jgi:hypothetical protein
MNDSVKVDNVTKFEDKFKPVLCSYIFYPDTSFKLLYPNEKAYIQGYINLKRYILFVTLDTCKQYLYPKFNMFWYLGKKMKVNMN